MSNVHFYRDSEISPQAWGCTALYGYYHYCHWNLPTSVGMYRTSTFTELASKESPHKREDVPRTSSRALTTNTISPQAWGCTGVK